MSAICFPGIDFPSIKEDRKLSFQNIPGSQKSGRKPCLKYKIGTVPAANKFRGGAPLMAKDKQIVP
jgi:hypothetical protein